MACLPIINITGQEWDVNTFGKEFLDNKKPATRAGSGEFGGLSTFGSVAVPQESVWNFLVYWAQVFSCAIHHHIIGPWSKQQLLVPWEIVSQEWFVPSPIWLTSPGEEVFNKL